MEYAAKSDSFEEFLSRLNEVLVEGFGPPAASTRQYLTGHLVGLPRSGTTVLFQLLARSGAVGYPSNLLAFFWQAPEVGARLQARLALGDPTISLRSVAGRTPEPLDPHEFGYFWRAALGHSRNSVESDLEPMPSPDLQRRLDAICDAFEAPVVHKNFLALVHADALRGSLVRQRFINIQRPAREICRSLIAVRERIGISDRDDFGLSTGPTSDTDLAVVDRVCRQVVQLERLQSAAGFTDAEDSLAVDYADLCADPRRVVEQVLALLGTDSHRLQDLPRTLDRQDPTCSIPDLDIDRALERARLHEELDHP